MDFFSRYSFDDFIDKVLCIVIPLWILASIGASIFIFIRDGLLEAILIFAMMLIGVPIALMLTIAIIILFIFSIYSSYSYLRNNKDNIALHWILLSFLTIVISGYLGFCFITDRMFFKYGTVYYPYEETGYYHGNEDCYYLNEEDFDPDYCRHMYLMAQIQGYKPCKSCINKDEEYGSRLISIGCYLLFFIIIIVSCEYRANHEDKRKRIY